MASMIKDAGAMIRSDLSYSGLWCGEASLEAFGITVRGLRQTCWANVLNSLKAAGYELTWAVTPWQRPRPTLNQFLKSNPTGDFILFTENHIIAIRDGVATDTETNRGGKRRVQEARRVA